MPPKAADSIHISEISLDTFHSVLAEYSSTRDRIATSKKGDLAALDHARYTTIPAAVAARRKGGPPAHITKAELTTLMDWKLTHGTFRPSLKGLIAQNDGKVVESVTRAGFEAWPDAKASIKKLTELRGVGPATTGLLLSVYEPLTAPFFSDELFRWCMAEDASRPIDWKRKIKYNVGEYLDVVEKVKSLRDRLTGSSWDRADPVSAVQCEQVAYVLGNRLAAEELPVTAVTAETAPTPDTVPSGKRKRTGPAESQATDGDTPRIHRRSTRRRRAES